MTRSQLWLWTCVASLWVPVAFAQNGEGEAAEVASAEGEGTAPSRVEVVPVAPVAPPPFTYPVPVDPNSHLPSSSRARIDINEGDRFDFEAGPEPPPAVRGNPDAPAITARSAEARAGLYVVQPGDTLSGISQRVFGQPWMWPKLWSYNPQIQNPHWIYPGDQLRLSRHATAGPFKDSVTLGAGLGGQPQLLEPDTVRLQYLGYIDDPRRGVVGQVVGARKPVQLMAQGNEVYFEIKPEQQVSEGQELSIFRPVREPPRVQGSRKPPGKLVAILGTVRVDYIHPEAKLARGVITESTDVIERGALVGELGRRYQLVAPVAARADVNARVLTSLYPHTFVAKHQVVFIDRGAKDGLVAGNRLFVLRRGDTWRRTLETANDAARSSLDLLSDDPLQVEMTPLLGDEQQFPEEVVAELRVVKVHPYSSLAVVSESEVEIVPGDRAVSRTGF